MMPVQKDQYDICDSDINLCLKCIKKVGGSYGRKKGKKDSGENGSEYNKENSNKNNSKNSSEKNNENKGCSKGRFPYRRTGSVSVQYGNAL